MWFSFWRRKRRDEDLDEEIAHDLMLETEKRVREGMSPEEAAKTSRKDFGNVSLVKETTREAWGWRRIEELTQDLRYAFRTLRGSPAFAFTAIATLALGIGANSAIFSIFDQVAFRPLPVKDGQQLVGVYESFHGRYSRHVYGNVHLISYPEFLNYLAQNRVFTGMAAYAEVGDLTLAGSTPESIGGLLVSQDYFSTLGGKAALGRTFSADEFQSPQPVAVLSHGFWQRRFGGDPSVIGKTIRLNQIPFSIVGIAGPDFAGTEPSIPDVWMPLVLQPEIMPNTDPRDFQSAENLSWLTALGRLMPGVTARQARVDLQLLASQMDRNHPGRDMEINVTPGTFLNNPEERTIVLVGGSIVLLAVGLVLLVACANVANLLLARAALRQKEIAVRLSLGATRARLIRQFLTESALLSLLSGGLGLLLARWSVKAGYAIIASRISVPAVDLCLDFNILIYTLLLSAAASLMFGLLPALHTTRPTLASALKEEGAFFGQRLSKTRLRNSLIAAQMAVCMVLLTGAGLLIRGLINVGTLDPGFHVKDVIITDLDLKLQRYNDASAATFYQQLMSRFDGQAGGESALAANPPLHGMMVTGISFEDPLQDAVYETNFNIVSANYFDVLGIGLSRGRTFTVAEMKSGAGVTIVSDALARTYWGGQDPLGKRIRYRQEGKLVSAEVVGVANDIRSIHLSSPDGPFFYLPANPNKPLGLSMITRSPVAGAQSSAIVRQLARALDPAVLVSVRTMAQSVETEVSPARAGAAMALLLGGLAIVLASVGVYGVMTFMVSQRTREIGIRMTLGAGSSSVLRLLLRDTMRPVAIGMVIGAVFAAIFSQAMTKVLLGVSPFDPIAFIGVAAFLSTVALVASYVPARHATRIDPVLALRYD